MFNIQRSRGCTFEDYLWCDIHYHRWPQTPRKSLGVKMAFLSRSLIIFSAPDESNRNSSPAYFLLDLPRELRHIHRLAGGRHPINHEKLAPLSRYIWVVSAAPGFILKINVTIAGQMGNTRVGVFISCMASHYYWKDTDQSPTPTWSTTNSQQQPQGSIHQNDALKTEKKN